MDNSSGRFRGLSPLSSSYSPRAADTDEELAKDKNSNVINSFAGVIRRDSAKPGDSTEQISLSLGCPVVGFPIQPYATVGRLDTTEDVNLTSRYSFVWYRNRKYYVCNADNCISLKSRSDEPKEMKCQCTTCLQYGNECNSYFCCPDCLRLNWKTHCLTHKPQDPSVQRQSTLSLMKSMTVDELATLQVKQIKNRKVPTEGWEKVSADITYTPTLNDAGHLLRIDVFSLFSKKCVFTTTSQPVINPPPYLPLRKWVIKAPITPSSISITSYNMLADIYCRPELYTNTPLWALDWEYRKDRLCKELEQRKSDVFCLQEIEKGQYQNYWLPMLKEWGYDGYFTTKTRLIYGSDEHVDGCATFFNASKIKLIRSQDISFNQMAEDLLNSGTISKNQWLRLRRGNVAHVLHFQLQNGISFFICNCHLFWDPKFYDVKLVQAQQLMMRLSQMGIFSMPLLICGDFNSEPNSAVYEFMRGDSILNHPEVVKDEEQLIRSAGLLNIAHPFQLVSAYAMVNGKDPKVTNYTDHYQGCLDYIWFTKNNINVLKTSVLPKEEEITAFRNLKLPNPIYPSDHLPLDAVIEIGWPRMM